MRLGRFNVTVRTAEQPLPTDEHQAAERTLARLVALAFAADHPERLPHAGGSVGKENVDAESH